MVSFSEIKLSYSVATAIAMEAKLVANAYKTTRVVVKSSIHAYVGGRSRSRADLVAYRWLKPDP